MELDRVVEALEGLAPLRLAASWDNVGLLVRGDRGVAPVPAGAGLQRMGQARCAPA